MFVSLSLLISVQVRLVYTGNFEQGTLRYWPRRVKALDTFNLSKNKEHFIGKHSKNYMLITDRPTHINIILKL